MKHPKFEVVNRRSGSYVRRSWDRKAHRQSGIDWVKQAVLLLVSLLIIASSIVLGVVYVLKIVLGAAIKVYAFFWRYKTFKRVVVATQLLTFIYIALLILFPPYVGSYIKPLHRPNPVKVIYAKEESKNVPTPELDTVKTKNESVEDMIKRYFEKDAVMALKIAKCESGLNPKARNKVSSARGVFQIIKGTWIGNRTAMGLSTDLDLRFDAEENIKTAKFIFDKRGWQPWECHNRGLAKNK